MMSFYMGTDNLYGLPERSSRYYLNLTGGKQPYRLYSVDKFPHPEWESQQGLYSGIPYITGHSSEGRPDMSIAWMSASETHVDILDYSPPNKRKGRLVNFITESGQLEFFMFGASSPKRV